MMPTDPTTLVRQAAAYCEQAAEQAMEGAFRTAVGLYTLAERCLDQADEARGFGLGLASLDVKRDLLKVVRRS